MIADEGCWERGCACHDSRVDGPGVELVRKREWVGLTEAERIDIIDKEISEQNTAHFALAQAIEAKLKEKNSD